MMKHITYFLMLMSGLGLGLVATQSRAYGEPLGADEQLTADQTFQYALEYNKSGTAASWHNPDAEHSGATVPLKTFQTADGIYCREFQQTIMVADQPQAGYGTACRQPDGSWQIVDPTLLRPAVQQPVEVTRVQVYEPPVRYSYPYPYWFFPGYLSFSFGYVEHHGHFRGGHDRHRRDRGFSGGRRNHRR